MIRDPSDGSLREPKPAEKPLVSSTTSGLPSPAAKDADRHERSRKWLADYRLTKALEDIRDNAATMANGGAWAAGIANLCLASIPEYRGKPKSEEQP